MSNTLATRQVNIGEYQLSVTTRDAGDDPALLEELTFRTVAAWIYCAGLIEKDMGVVDVAGSVEERLAAEKEVKFPDRFTDPRVSVWDTYRGSKNPSFHLNSDDNLQVALNTYFANRNGIVRALAKYGIQTPQKPTNSSATPSNGNNTHEAPKALENGIVAAKRAPNPKSPQYADGQQVSFTINKIVLGVHQTSGAVIYSLWSPLGPKYAIKTVYRTASNSDEDSRDYAAAASTLEALHLAIPGNVQALGSWRLICQAAHVKNEKDNTTKEYMNVVKLESVTP